MKRLIPLLLGATLLAGACGSDADESVEVAAESPTTSEGGIPIETPTLVGQAWEVGTVQHGDAAVAPPAGTVVTIEFRDDGTLEGNAGCNSYSGTYAIDGTDLSIQPPVVTPGTCADAADWDEFLDVLPTVTSFGSAGGSDPILFAPGDASIVLQPSGKPLDTAAEDALAAYVGLTEAKAQALADEQGVPFRVSSIDGEEQVLTMDFMPVRVNVDLVDGVVIGGSLG